MKTHHLHRRAILLVVFAAAGVVGTLAHRSESASLTNTSVTLSNSRISFSGQLTNANTVGSSQAIIENSGNPSNSTDGVVEGDVLTIGANNYTVKDIVSSSTFALTSGLASGDSDDNEIVVGRQYDRLAVRFNTASAIANGSIRVLIPAIANDADSSDGVPDQGGWDLNDIAAGDITCPADTGDYDFGTPTVNASVTVGSSDYHVISCPYTDTGAVGANFQSSPIFIGDASTVAERMINPVPINGHTAGNADTYRILVQNLNNGGTVVDSTTVSVGVIEAVRITATVAPQLTFTITGLSGTQCGLATTSTATATTVPLGELSITNFSIAAQKLLVSTNASNGYVVTALANDQLGKDGETCTGDPTANPDCIPDSPGDSATGATMAPDNHDLWADTLTKGFAYTIANVDAGTVPFQYSSTDNDCSGNAGTACYRQFADAEAGQAPEEIFSNTTVADTQDVNVCYKAVISPTQAAGNYETYVTYTATATF